jgi:hypothetical protein
LGIDIDKIKQKFISIMTQRGIKENADYDDMAGPLLVCVIFGVLLLFVSVPFLCELPVREARFNSGRSTASDSQAVLASSSSSI